MPTPDFVLALRAKVGHTPLWLPGVCAVVLRPLDEPKEVLLVRRSDDGTWTPIKGIMDPGEEVGQSAIRECLEETGVRITVDRLVNVGIIGPVHYDNGDVTTYLEHTVRAAWVSGEPRVGEGVLCVPQVGIQLFGEDRPRTGGRGLDPEPEGDEPHPRPRRQERRRLAVGVPQRRPPGEPGDQLPTTG